MKRTIALLLLIIMAYSAYSITIESGANVILYCNNNQSGRLEGTTATINCTDSKFNLDLTTRALTNRGVGVFNQTFTLTTDSYTCEIDCGETSSIDYTRYLYVRTTPLIATDNIGINWGDVSNPTTSVGLTGTTVDLVSNAVDATAIATGAIDADAIATDAIGATEIAANAIGNSEIAADAIGASEIATNAIGAAEIAAAAITSSEAPNLDVAVSTRGTSTLTTSDNIGINWGDVSNPTTVLDLAGTTISTVDTATVCTDVTNGVTIAAAQTVATCTDITNPVTVGTNNDKTGYSLTTQDWTTDSDLTSLQSHGDSEWSTATGFSTATDITDSQAILEQSILSNSTAIITQGDSAWITATGFSTHSAADVWTTGGRELSTPNNYKADVSSLATSLELSGTQDTLEQSILQNSSAIITQGDIAWTTATGFTTSTDVDKLEEAILSNSTAVISRGDSAWITAVGFSTHSAADVWLSGTRTLTVADWTTDSDLTTQNQLLEQSIFGNSSDVKGAILSNSTAVIARGDVAWITATGISATITQADILRIANATWANNLSKEAYTNQRWTAAYYLDRIFKYP